MRRSQIETLKYVAGTRGHRPHMVNPSGEKYGEKIPNKVFYPVLLLYIGLIAAGLWTFIKVTN